MSNTSIRPIPTLKGMFSVPRVTQGRNFLQENKKSLRSLEKATTEKRVAKEPVRPKWMPQLRRTASEAHDPKRCQAENTSISSQHGTKACQLLPSNSRSQHSLSSQGAGEPSEHYVASEKRDSQKVQNAPQLVENSSERCLSCGTQRSSTSIGIQTEDIMDELYLTNALKKCNYDSKSMMSSGRNACIDTGDDYDDNYRNYNQYDEEDQPLSARSKESRLNMDDNEAMPMPQLQNLAIDNGDDDGPHSARSRATIGSMASNITKSKRREHKLGSRDDLRLPRYLEKEKRDRADAKGRIEARDPECPRGHVLMSEPDRVAALAHAKKRFDMLIHELNHMPMTAETLRIRMRKSEIDKELTVVEDEIRIYSKEKVYVKANKSRNL